MVLSAGVTSTWVTPGRPDKSPSMVFLQWPQLMSVEVSVISILKGYPRGVSFQREMGGAMTKGLFHQDHNQGARAVHPFHTVQFDV